MQSLQVLSDRQCKHCGHVLSAAAGEFCCNGCATIYAAMQEKGLGHFYEMKRTPLADNRADPQARSYEELEEPSAAPALQLREGAGEVEVKLALDGIHCSGCLWVLERLPQFHPGVLSARVNLSEGTLRLRIDSQRTSISAVARTLDGLGYPTRIPALNAEMTPDDRLARRSELMRIAAAGFSAANTMLLAVSLFQGFYTGIDAHTALLFRWLSAMLCIPALWAGWPMTRNALQALRHGQLL